MPHPYTSLSRRRFVGAILGAPLLAATPAARAQVADLNDAINKAGRQRMLSQRMAKAWLAIGQEIQVPRAQRILGDSMALFDRQHVELKAYAPTPTVHATYTELESVWSEYKAVLVGQRPARPAAERLIELDGRVLALAHQGTVQLEKHSGLSVGRLVNIAGRQRMLSQRMAKYYLTQSWELTIGNAAQALQQARQEFTEAVSVLRDAPEATPAIRQELELADQQWTFFDNALRRLGDSSAQSRRAVEVFSSSENLLRIMDDVTGLYAQLAI